MLVFPKAGLVLLAAPKTATTAIESALAPQAAVVLRNPPELKHMPLYRYNRLFKPLLEKTGLTGMETAAMIREPEDWLRSWYRYRSREALQGQPQYTGNLDFDSFVKAYLRARRPAFANIGSQAKFLSDGNGAVGVTHLFRYENLSGYIRFLSQRLTLDIHLQRKNVSPSREARLSPGVRKRLREKCAQEFAIWQNAL